MTELQRAIAETTTRLTIRMFVGMALFDIVTFVALHLWPWHPTP